MSAADVQFVQAAVAEAKQNGRTFSRDVLKDCYYADLKLRGATELPAVSEKWVDFYWERLSSIPFDRLDRNAKSAPKITKLLIELLGK